MMYGNNGGGWMGGGWIMLIGALVCIAIIGAVVWLVMRALQNKQAAPLSSLPLQQPPYQMNGQGDRTPSQQPTGTYQEGDKQYSYQQSVQPPHQHERLVG